MPKKNIEPPAPPAQRVVVELQVTGGESGDSAAYRVVDRRGRDRDERMAKNRQALCGTIGPYGTDSVDYRDADKLPQGVQEQIKEARKWHERCLFMQVLVSLKTGFYNYGFQLRPAERPIDEKQQQALTKWQRLNRQKLRALVKEVWEDRVITDHVVAFWREKAGRVTPRVIVVPPEKCQYSDAMGIEKLKVQLDWKEEDLKTSDKDKKNAADRLTREQIRRYTNARFTELSEEEGEFFRVLKRSRAGWGFTVPRMYAVFRTLQQDESMQVADNLWAFVCRTVIRHWKLGHEIRNGPMAGSGRWFWDPVRDKALRETVEGRVGVLDLSTNFDVSVDFPFPGAERFKAEKYESVFTRLGAWAGPVGMMLLLMLNNKATTNLDWLKLLRVEANEEREDVGPYLAEIINTVFAPPVELDVVWSNTVFSDPRFALETLKFLVTSGALDYQTALEEGNFDVDTVRERKAKEGEMIQDPEKKWLLLPPYDPAHGPVAPAAATAAGGDGTGDTGGRPAGT